VVEGSRTRPVATLAVTTGPLGGASFHLDRDELVLGRGELADLDLDDEAVSRRHALLSATGAGWKITDLASGNGTFLNGRVVRGSAELADGDELRLGATRLAYRVEALSPPPQPAEVPEVPSGAASVDLETSPTSLGGEVSPEIALRLLHRRLELVSAIAEVMSRTTDLDDVLAAVLQAVRQALPQTDRACVAVLSSGGDDLHVRSAIDQNGVTSDMPLSQKLLHAAVARRQAILVLDTEIDEAFPGRVTVRGLGVRSIICLPLLVANRAWGILQLDTSAQSQPFQFEDLQALAGVAAAIALAMANASLHARLLAHELEMRDLELAHRVQQQMLPANPPELTDYRCAFRCVPALSVGGDFYDMLPLPNGDIALTIGDVSGKGVSAALLMARLMSDLRFIAGQGLPPGEALEQLGRRLSHATRESMFATLLYLELTPDTGELEIANAGHPRPLIRKADGTVIEVELPSGLPAGVRTETTYATHPGVLYAGESLLLFTDGLIEATSPSGERFGEPRVREVLTETANEPEAIVTALVDAVVFWQAESQPADDLTLVCLKRLR
jgi:sigma-B regulation protein RsbU (phosphoserine phosphatase)